MIKNKKTKEKNLKENGDFLKRNPTMAKKKIKEKDKEEKREIKIILENEKPLEERIENSNEEINETKFEDFFENPETPRSSPSLRKISPPQRALPRLEENLIQSGFFGNEKEEENSINYNMAPGEKKKESEYIPVSQEYSAIQKENLKSNPHFLIKEQSFVDLNQKNIVENFPKRNLNPFAEESLRNPENTDKNYLFKSSFVEKERKPHNPFEKKEIKYEKFEQ